MSMASDAFQGMSQMTGLYLTSNQLKELPPGIFSGLTSLTSLDLRYNNLTELSPEVFLGLSSLRTLEVINNQLSVLPADVFSGLSSLRTLSLDNQLQFAPLGAQQRAALTFSSQARVPSATLWAVNPPYQGPVTCKSIPWTIKRPLATAA